MDPDSLLATLLALSASLGVLLQHLVSQLSTMSSDSSSSDEAFSADSDDISATESDGEAEMFLLAANTNLAESQMPKRRRKAIALGQWYVKPRSLHRWNTFMRFTEGDDLRWEEHLRLPRPVFAFVCDLLREDLEQKEIPLSFHKIPSRVLSVEKKVAMSLHRLASPMNYSHLSEKYGVGKSTIGKVFWQFIHALNRHLHTYVHWPTAGEEMQAVKQAFQVKQGFPNCCGAIDVTHIDIDLPDGEMHSHWYDRKQRYSMSLQAIVDADMKFRDIMVGWTGCVNDIRLLRNSTFYNKAQNGQILNGPLFIDGNYNFPEYIVGDGGYMLFPWLMIPYPAPVRDDHKEFNFMLSSTRIVVERAFGRLKGTWSYIHGIVKRPDMEFLPKVIAGACILHNILIEQGVDMPEGNVNAEVRVPVAGNQVEAGGTELRDSLMTYVLRQ